MDDSLQRLRAKIAKNIAEREALLQPLRQHAGDRALASLASLEQDLAAFKRMAARLAQTTLFEPREHRALRHPPLR